jgi:hypothetical protein
MRGSFLWSTEEQNSTRLSVAGAIHRNNDTVANVGLLSQGSLKVLGMNVKTRRRNDDVFLAASEPQVAFCIQFAEVACTQPALLLGGNEFSGFPIACSNVFPAD